MVAVCTVGITLAVQAFAQQGGSPPKVDIFAEPRGDAILVTWENPDDTDVNIAFVYQVTRSINDDGNFAVIFDKQRDLDNRVVNPRGNDIFFFLDEDVTAGNCYVYSVGAGRPTGNPNPVLSDDTRCIEPNISEGRLLSTNGFLIISNTSPPPQPPLMLGGIFFMAFAQSPTPILTTTQNPQEEPYILALAPTPIPETTQDGCDQTIQVIHQTDQRGGQQIDITATLIENEIPRNQGTIGTSDSDKRLFSRNLFIPFPDQVVQNFTDLKIQLDFTGRAGDPRAMSVFEVILYIPEDNGAC